MDKNIIRINELSKKAKTIGLSDAEIIERDALRAEYIKGFRDSLTQTLDNTYIVDSDGNKTQVKRK